MSHTQGAIRCLVIALSLLAVSVVAVPANVSAMGVDVTGRWTLMVDDTHGGMWRGSMSLTQTGMEFLGMAMLELIGDSGRPGMISGPITMGMVYGPGSGFYISVELVLGSDRMMSFEGRVSEDGQSLSGTWENTDSGTWSAEKQAGQPAPALSGVALAVLFGLLMAVGVVYARRQAA